MLRLLRQNTQINYIVILVFMLAFWGIKFVYMPTALEANGSGSYFFHFNLEKTWFQYLSAFIAFAGYYFFSLYIERVNFNVQIINSAYQVPSLFFVLLTGTIINVQRCVPEFFATLLIYMALFKIFDTYNKYQTLGNIFDVGLLFSLAVLISYKFIYLLPYIIWAMFIIKSVSWRDIISFLLGFASVLVIVLFFVWEFGDFATFGESVKDIIPQKITGRKYTLANCLFHAPIFFAIIMSMLTPFVANTSKKISERRFYNSMSLMVLYCVIFMLTPFSADEIVSILYLPLAFMLANVFVNGNKIWANIVLYGLILSLILSQTAQMLYFKSIF